MRRAAVLALALVALAGCGGAKGRYEQSAAQALPRGMPRWIAADVRSVARGNGDPRAMVASYRGGRFPIVVLTGTFVCNSCSWPAGGSAPRGSVIAARYDAVRHTGTDFGLADSRAAALASLCNGVPCTRAAFVLDSAFDALYANRLGDPPFDHRAGSSHCHIRLPVHEYKEIRGRCSVSMSLGRRPVVTFRERWNGLDAQGRRYSPSAPRRHHVWIVTESPAAFVTSVRSSGDYPPQWRRPHRG